MTGPVQQSLRMQRRRAAEKNSGQLMRASRDARNAGQSFEADHYRKKAMDVIKLAHPISKSEKRRSQEAGY
jgi:hypothetical protein